MSAPASNPARSVELDRGELDDTLGFVIRRGWICMEQMFNRYMADTGVTPQLYAILIVIEANPGCRISDLCRAVGVSPNNIVPALDLLLERGLVFRDFSSRDRRTKRLSLTEAGRLRLAELRRAHQPMTDEINARLGDGNLAALIELLRALTDNGPPP